MKLEAGGVGFTLGVRVVCLVVTEVIEDGKPHVWKADVSFCSFRIPSIALSLFPRSFLL